MTFRIVLGACLCAPVLIAALLSHVWTPAAHWLGTDGMGRDVAAQLVLGARSSLGLALTALGLGLACGLPLGLLGGSVRWIGGLLRLVTGLIWTCPVLILVLILMAGGSPPKAGLILALGLWNAACFAAAIAPATQRLWQTPFVQSARDIGAGGLSIVLGHLLPNLAQLVGTAALVQLSFTLMAEAALAYLGLGSAESWGALLNAADVPRHVLLAAGGVIGATCLGVNLMAAGLRLGLPHRDCEGLAWY